MNIETQIYKAKSEKLMEQIKVLENSLQEALTQDNQYKSAFLTGEKREEEIKRGKKNSAVFSTGYSTGISDMTAQAMGVHSLEALGAAAVGGLVGASAVGTRGVGIPFTKLGLGANVATDIRPGGFSVEKFSDAIGAGKNLDDAAFEGIESAKVKVRSTNPPHGWGTKALDKLVGEVKKTEKVAEIAADMPAQIEKALSPHYPTSSSVSQIAQDAAERAAIAADATEKYTKAASASTPKIAQAIAKSPTASQAVKFAASMGKGALKATIGKLVTPVGAGLSAYEAYKEFSKGNYGRGAANVGLAAMNLIPGLNLLAIPGEVAMQYTEESVQMKGSEVNKKLYNFIN
jgi:hypothetical protein